jgi:hypothetical protein
MHSKRITLHRADHVIPDQTVMVHPAVPGDATGAVHPGGPKVEHAFAAGRVPLGYVAKLKDGKVLELGDDLYPHVDNGDTVEVVPVMPPEEPQEYPKMLFKKHETPGKPSLTAIAKDPDHEAKLSRDGFGDAVQPEKSEPVPDPVQA